MKPNYLKEASLDALKKDHFTRLIRLAYVAFLGREPGSEEKVKHVADLSRGLKVSEFLKSLATEEMRQSKTHFFNLDRFASQQKPNDQPSELAKPTDLQPVFRDTTEDTSEETVEVLRRKLDIVYRLAHPPTR